MYKQNIWQFLKRYLSGSICLWDAKVTISLQETINKTTECGPDGRDL